MNILSITHPSTRALNSASQNFAQQQGDAWRTPRSVADRHFGLGYGNRGYASKPDSLRTSRYRASSASPRFRIS